MNDPGFDPAKTVVLEEAPDVEPDRASPGTVRLVEASTDDLLIHARLTAPAILLVTDGWSKGWRAAAADGAAGPHYRVVPADYVLRAIALPAGDHRIRLEYRPTSFAVGKWTSLVAWLLLGIVAGTRIIRLSARHGWHVPEPRAKGVGAAQPEHARRLATFRACHPNVSGPGNGRKFESSSPPLLRYHFPRDHGHVRLCGHIRLCALAMLTLEITFSRLLSVVTWYHLAFFAISAAMLGMTAGATKVYLHPSSSPPSTCRKTSAGLAGGSRGPCRSGY